MDDLACGDLARQGGFKDEIIRLFVNVETGVDRLGGMTQSGSTRW
ncbi:hypothetical protein [Methanogenium cariaci]|nr:hypothetical protein [Methanogenium cariaci]